MPFNSQGYGNLFGGAVGEGGLGDLDTEIRQFLLRLVVLPQVHILPKEVLQMC